MRNAKLLFIDDGCECDICNEKNTAAHIEDLIGNVSIYCIECLKWIIKSADE